MKRRHIIIALLLFVFNISIQAQSNKTVKQPAKTVVKKVVKTVSKPTNSKSVAAKSVSSTRKSVNTKKKTANKTKTTVETTAEKIEKVKTEPEVKEVEPQYKSFSDPQLIRYVKGGFVKDNKIHLLVNDDYAKLSLLNKQDVVNKLHAVFPENDIVIYRGNDKGEMELWLAGQMAYSYVDSWNVDSMRIEDYMPLELKRSGRLTYFYYIGGSLTGSKGASNGTLNYSIGTYLWKDKLDISIGTNMGYNKASGSKAKFAGSMSLSSRYYFPLHMKKINLSPYLGGAISWTYAPDSFWELQALAGACWFVGSGSLDLGLQYGKESKFGMTLGYTFRIPYAKKTGK